MAVYTHLSADDIDAFVSHYGVGKLVSAKGIAEGVSNSNWIIETAAPTGESARFILTVYEERTNTEDLPFFLDLLDHLSAKGCPVPRTIHDASGAAYRQAEGKAAALIEYLPGISIDRPSVDQARAVGSALAGIHLAASDFSGSRVNDLGPAGWRALLQQCGGAGLGEIDSALPELVDAKLGQIERDWPDHLPASIIHSDLFPDNVLMLGDRVSGLIDFYFACNDMSAYDLAVAHVAWSFSSGGGEFHREIGDALIEGYDSVRPLIDQEKAAMPLLCQGAAMRFIATRAYDWLNTPAEALVTRKDPMDFANRLRFYDEAGANAFPFGQQAGTATT